LVDEGISKGTALLSKRLRSVFLATGDWEGYREVGK